MNRIIRRHTLWCIFVLASLVVPPAAMGLPASPRRFVDNLDERCYVILQPQPALGLTLTLSHLDPVLVKKGLPDQTVTLQQPVKLCVPVKKNNVAPAADTLPFIQYLDWKCYGITGPSLNLQLHLTQLNPQIVNILGPSVTVTVGVPQQLCVPVVKNNLVPPPDVQQLVQYVDVECFAVTSPAPPPKNILLNHLNPMFSGRPAETRAFGPAANQLCVPVAKDGDIPPTTVLQYIQYSDVLCYPMGGINLDSLLTLTQLDPVMLSH